MIDACGVRQEIGKMRRCSSTIRRLLLGVQKTDIARPAKILGMQLAALDTAKSVEDMDVPGFRLHPLTGGEQGRRSVWVNGNWRLTFEFKDGHAYVLDYEDYH